MSSPMLPFTLIVMAVLLAAFGPAQLGAAGSALARRARELLAYVLHGRAGHRHEPGKRTR